MGLLDFGTKAQVENLADHIGVGMQLVEEEIRKSSNQSTPPIRGLAYGLMDDKEKLVILISSLSQSTFDNLKVRYKNEKISFFSFIHEMKRVSDKIDEITGINFFNSTITKDGVIRQVKKLN